MSQRNPIADRVIMAPAHLAPSRDLHLLGFEFGEPQGGRCAVVIPPSWEARAESAGKAAVRWALLDGRGRHRGEAFCYLDGFIDICRLGMRARYEVLRCLDGSGPGVADAGVIFRRVPLPAPEFCEHSPWHDAIKDAKRWLYANLPEWRNPFAYWDMP